MNEPQPKKPTCTDCGVEAEKLIFVGFNTNGGSIQVCGRCFLKRGGRERVT